MSETTEPLSAPVSLTEVASGTSRQVTAGSAASVNRKLRPRRTVETAEYAGFARRAVAGLGRRVAAGDVEAIGELVKLSEAVDAAMVTAVTGLRAEGYSWAEIADRLGVSRQAVAKRFG